MILLRFGSRQHKKKALLEKGMWGCVSRGRFRLALGECWDSKPETENHASSLIIRFKKLAELYVNVGRLKFFFNLMNDFLNK